MKADWKTLLDQGRRKDAAKLGKPKNKPTAKPKPVEARTETERDYDRILFSTPVRRLADKTQVFPLDPNDSVRTRLTHSHEVSNLSRSIGINLAFNHQIGSPSANFQRNVPAMLATIGLAHDLGNPPFGHKGESAVRDWFQKNAALLKPLKGGLKEDFLLFEGNAQTLRLLTRLQLLNDNFGLNLTYGTLAALLKYTVSARDADPKAEYAGRKKNGFFQSEKAIVEEVWERTGLRAGVRHPFAYVMEACDDIAYSVMDTEDAVKKGLTSFHDVMAFIRHEAASDQLALDTCTRSEVTHNEYKRQSSLSPWELNDISMQMFRVYAISAMVTAVTDTFLTNLDKILSGTFKGDLISKSSAAAFCAALKVFDTKHAYRHRSVLKVELAGYKVIQKLMDYLWIAIDARADLKKLGSKRADPFANYVYNRISENYRRIAEDSSNQMPLRYRELQLITDMISGMTDSFAMSLEEELRRYAPPPASQN